MFYTSIFSTDRLFRVVQSAPASLMGVDFRPVSSHQSSQYHISKPGVKDQVQGLIADLAEVEVKVDRQDRKLSDYLERAPAALGEQVTFFSYEI